MALITRVPLESLAIPASLPCVLPHDHVRPHREAVGERQENPAYASRQASVKKHKRALSKQRSLHANCFRQHWLELVENLLNCSGFLPRCILELDGLLDNILLRHEV